MATKFSDKCNQIRARVFARRNALTTARMVSLFDPNSKTSEARIERAKERLAEAAAEMAQHCPESITVTLENGTKFTQDRGVPDESAKNARDLLKDKIPADDVTDLTEIKLRDDPPPDTKSVRRKKDGKAVNITVKAAATYNKKTKTINDYHPTKEDELKHEIGHHVYYHRMTAKERAAWDKLWRDKRDKMPTDYAKSHEKEGFAEAYEFLRNNKELDDDIRKKMIELAGANPSTGGN